MSLSTFEHQKQQLDYLRGVARIAVESKQYQNMNESSLLNLMLSATDLGISPMKAINGGFYVVNGKVCMSTALMADRIRKAGHSIQIKAMTKDKCIIYAQRKDNGDSIHYEYTMEDAGTAGLTSSTTWKKYPKQMLYNRCMSSVARILFSDVVGNSYSEEERFDIQNVPAEDRPLEDAEAELTIEPELSGNSGHFVGKPDKVSELVSNPYQLTEEQCAELDVLLEGENEIKSKLLAHLNLINVYEMNPKDFDRIVKVLKDKKIQRVTHE